MAKKTPKKRTKTAIAARKYEKKLKQRARFGEPQAKAIIQRRKERSERYQEERRRKREAERRASTQDEVNVVGRASAERLTGERIPVAASAIGRSEDGVQEEGAELKQQLVDEVRNPLFVTPAPDTRCLGSKVPTCGFVGRHEQVPSTSRTMQRHGQDAPGSSRIFNSHMRPTAGRPRLLRRSLGGALLQSAGGNEYKAEPATRDSVEDLQAQLEGLRRRREELIQREIEIGIQIQQHAMWNRAVPPRTVVNQSN